jgi:hypothetical protein
MTFSYKNVNYFLFKRGLVDNGQRGTVVGTYRIDTKGIFFILYENS